MPEPTNTQPQQPHEIIHAAMGISNRCTHVLAAAQHLIDTHPDDENYAKIAAFLILALGCG